MSPGYSRSASEPVIETGDGTRRKQPARQPALSITVRSSSTYRPMTDSWRRRSVSDGQRKTVDVGTPLSLFAAHLPLGSQNPATRYYHVSRDGQRFLMLGTPEVTLAHHRPPELEAQTVSRMRPASPRFPRYGHEHTKPRNRHQKKSFRAFVRSWLIGDAAD